MRTILNAALAIALVSGEVRARASDPAKDNVNLTCTSNFQLLRGGKPGRLSLVVTRAGEGTAEFNGFTARLNSGGRYQTDESKLGRLEKLAADPGKARYRLIVMGMLNLHGRPTAPAQAQVVFPVNGQTYSAGTVEIDLVSKDFSVDTDWLRANRHPKILKGTCTGQIW